MQLFKNKKGQAGGILSSIIWLFFGGAFFVFGIASWINIYMADIVTSAGLTGLTAWFFVNLNFIIGLAWIIGFIAIARYGF